MTELSKKIVQLLEDKDAHFTANYVIAQQICALFEQPIPTDHCPERDNNQICTPTECIPPCPIVEKLEAENAALKQRVGELEARLRPGAIGVDIDNNADMED